MWAPCSGARRIRGASSASPGRPGNSPDPRALGRVVDTPVSPRFRGVPSWSKNQPGNDFRGPVSAPVLSALPLWRPLCAPARGTHTLSPEDGRGGGDVHGAADLHAHTVIARGH